MLNRIILIGRLATDPELKFTPSGVAVCSFRIAVDRPYTSQSGQRETDFITVKVWREQGERVANWMAKGRLVAVEGRLEIRAWTAQDGTKRSTAEVVADNVRFLDRPPQQGEQPAEAGLAPSEGSGAYAQRPAPVQGGPLDNGIPAPPYAPPANETDYGDPFTEE
jgi:single-strand DNA-binding protein